MEGLRGKAGFSTHTHSDDFDGGGDGTLRSIYARTVHAFGVVERASCVSARERERGCTASAAHHDATYTAQPKYGRERRSGTATAWAWLAGWL